VRLIDVRLLVEDYAASFTFYRDLLGSIAELPQRGVAVMREPEDRPDWGIRVAYIRDPDHNLIELNQSL
jgi:catechol 2,3-dioxygenase-like lactoylglutathione lyase family enzyme